MFLRQSFYKTDKTGTFNTLPLALQLIQHSGRINRVPVDFGNLHQFLNAKLGIYDKEEKDSVARIVNMHENALHGKETKGKEKEKESERACGSEEQESRRKLDPYTPDAGRLGPSVAKFSKGSGGSLQITPDLLEVKSENVKTIN